MWIFFIFWPSKICASPTVSPPPFPLPGATSPPFDVVTLPCRVTLSSHGANMSSQAPLYLLLIFCPAASPFELKSKHWIHTTTVGHPPRTALHCYKNIISTFAILSTSQSCLHFISSLARAPCHQSFTHRHHSLSPPFHAHRPSA
jgi:hypothetical protein